MRIKLFPTEVQKFVRLPGNEIIIFPKSIEHFTFQHLGPVSAGSCIIDLKKKKVICFGESITLRLQADEQEDTRIATLQVFGE